MARVFVAPYKGCALRSDSELKCWGYGAHLDTHETHIGDAAGEIAAYSAASLGAGRTPIEAAAGTSATCVLLDNGTVKCWGLNSNALMGNYTGYGGYGHSAFDVGDYTNPVVLPPTKTPAELCLGGVSFACARMTDGSVYCWGRNLYGAAGIGTGPDGSIGDSAAEMGTNMVAVLLGGKTATQIGCGSGHACALLSDNTVKCWGEGGARLGNELANTSIGATPGTIPDVNIGTNMTILSLEVGSYHNCAVILDNSDNLKKVKCWGSNNHGQLGYNHTLALGDGVGEMGDNLPYINFGIAQEPTRVYPGNRSTCVEFTPGKIRCWGDQNRNGTSASILGDGGAEMLSLPDLSFGAGLTIKKFVASFQGGCALVEDVGLVQTVRCFGVNALGGGGTRLAAAAHTFNFGADTFVDFGRTSRAGSSGAEGGHMCAITNNGVSNRLRCWGDNGNGQLAAGKSFIGDEASDMGVNLTAIDLGSYLATPLKANEVAFGYAHTCILSTVGVVKCKGDNSERQLGDGGTTNYGSYYGQTWAARAIVALPLPAVKITAAANSTCVLLTDNTVRCWGENTAITGNLGAAAPTPVAVNIWGTNRKVVDINLRSRSLCALLDNGGVKCIGVQNNGSLGYGIHPNTYGDSASEIGDFLPYMDFGLKPDTSPYTAKKIFGSHAYDATNGCIVADDNSARCWGWGNVGNLGTNGGGILGMVSPLIASPVAKVISGAYHTCAVFSDGNMKCFGINTYGQLGRGNTTTAGYTGAGNTLMAALPNISFGAGVTVVDADAASVSSIGNNGFTCAALSDNKVKCWGYNAGAVLGTGDLKNWGAGAGETVENIPEVDLNW